MLSLFEVRYKAVSSHIKNPLDPILSDLDPQAGKQTHRFRKIENCAFDLVLGHINHVVLGTGENRSFQVCVIEDSASKITPVKLGFPS